jgi:CRP/FNR family transcriptional regulator, cyclic AMP receptor protein
LLVSALPQQYRSRPRPSLEGRLVRLLDADPELGERMRPDRRREATEILRARVLELPRGEWDCDPMHGAADIGHLVLTGAVAREVALEDIISSELLGAGDLHMPVGSDGPDRLPGQTVRCQVLAATRVAVLDTAFAASLARFPEVSAALMARLGTQADRLATLKAIAQLNSVERRVLALLRHLAARWGRMTPRGVVIPLTLSHRLLGELIGARRPTVSVAVAALARAGAVHRLEDGTWLLTAELAPDGAQLPPRAVPHRRRLVNELD